MKDVLRPVEIDKAFADLELQKEKIKNTKDQIRSRGIRDKSGQEALQNMETRIGMMGASLRLKQQALENTELGNDVQLILGVLDLAVNKDMDADVLEQFLPAVQNALKKFDISAEERNGLLRMFGRDVNISVTPKVPNATESPKAGQAVTESDVDDIVNEVKGNR
jgi:hypothetical protein